MAGQIDFYFDFSSPYAYLGSHLIEPVAQRHGRDLVWHPFMLGVAMKGERTFPLTQYPMKGDYSRMDFDRTARYHGIPFVMPEAFPKVTLAASRGFLWIDQQDPARAVGFAKRIFAAYFTEGRDIADPVVVTEIAEEAGVNADAFSTAIQETEIKRAFTASVEETVFEKKIFGAPYFIVDGERFWGADRVSQLDEWLARGGW
ncbi:MAG: 2-hydroxychromene-2-carboxylate isomerase [Sneathiella sp.]|jgi:2-hydroxychromene-2-carboxylate isomerase|uniref:2-hydroxychromene-2-carboxylate isomerase n=1 Tax=Sneathiella sp. TaxID=1964365 RepID=UPI000C4CC5CE|nr:2-hydroxychromene-2-carboxylate isomerase [Sneathiella sp.]MAL79826.1 2-hydroxychromene-2-carboxylate isomerase [Sneathiella sp.]|tara:strand:- start:208 stop:813 length:606 start_codon:yes stop_codon:yes gene_type:complete